VPNPNAIVSKVVRLERPSKGLAKRSLRAEPDLAVVLDDGRRISLDSQNPRSHGFAKVLDGLEKLNRPAYLEVDPETGTLARLFMPDVAVVIGLRQTEAGYEVALNASHTRYVLRPDNPDFAEIEETLRASLTRQVPVMVTENDRHEIVDVSFFEGGPEAGPSQEQRQRSSTPTGFAQPSTWWPCVSPDRAQQIFDMMKVQTCDPAATSPPCIPFVFPDGGCWVRAHEMCRLILAMGYSPRKTWLFGSLRAPTRNHPSCIVYWTWHVAPTICVRDGSGWPRRMVIDPSLFEMPVSEEFWMGYLGDPHATLHDTPWTTFWYWSTGYPKLDPVFANTNQLLILYRLFLQNRINQIGPPPYANCP
jgi:hypothetical protein